MSDAFLPEANITWQESADVFAPTPRSKKEFMATVDLLSAHALDAAVFVDANAREHLDREAQADTSREHGGILLGEVFTDEAEGHYVVVREVVAAQDTLGSAVHLQFQEESWKPVWKRLEEQGHLNVVGWYHTHPGLGVFLSSTDIRTQRLYFSHAWQLAIVLDPVRNEIGYFVGKNGTPCHAAVFRNRQVTDSSHASSL